MQKEQPLWTQLDPPATGLDALRQGTVDAIAHGGLWAKANAEPVPAPVAMPYQSVPTAAQLLPASTTLRTSRC